MKYVIAIVIVAALLRADVLLRLYDQGVAKFQQSRPQDSSALDAEPGFDPQTGSRDLTIPARAKFLGLLHDFRISPEPTFRQSAVGLLRKDPKMFGPKLDAELESAIFGWRDLLIQGARELPPFLMELDELLVGENKTIITRFFAVMMDLNLDQFLLSYSNSKDSNCMIATTVGDNIGEEEVLNVLFDREKDLNDYLLRDKVDPKTATFVNSCLLVLRLHLAKVAPAPTSTASEEGLEANDPGDEGL